MLFGYKSLIHLFHECFLAAHARPVLHRVSCRAAGFNPDKPGSPVSFHVLLPLYLTLVTTPEAP